MSKGSKPDSKAFGEGIRVTPTGLVRAASWKIVPSADAVVKGSTQ